MIQKSKSIFFNLHISYLTHPSTGTFPEFFFVQQRICVLWHQIVASYLNNGHKFFTKIPKLREAELINWKTLFEVYKQYLIISQCFNYYGIINKSLDYCYHQTVQDMAKTGKLQEFEMILRTHTFNTTFNKSYAVKSVGAFEWHNWKSSLPIARLLNQK